MKWTAGQTKIWIRAWLAKHPQPGMTKQGCWNIAHRAWLEMRKEEQQQERRQRKELGLDKYGDPPSRNDVEDVDLRN